MRNFFNMDNPLFRTLGRLADLMILNICFIICCIPIVTIGASLTALNYVTLKIAEEEEGYIIRSFFKSFRQNFKQATLIWLILLAVGLVLGLDISILYGSEVSYLKVILVLIFIFTFVFAMVYLYVFPVLARFDNTIKNTLRNSLIMAIADFPRTLLMLVVTVAPVIVTFLTTTTIGYGILLWLMFGFALVAYINCLLFKRIFKKYMPKDEEEEKDPDDWFVEELPKDGEEGAEAGTKEAAKEGSGNAAAIAETAEAGNAEESASDAE